MLLILKIIKIFKKYYQSIVVMWQHMFSMAVTRTVWRRELDFLNILIIFNISNIDKDINKELPEDDLIEDRNMLECFLKCFK
jgi:vacuolar-type H+-ATPase subunit C/Vma6